MRPVAEMSNCGSQVTNPLRFHKSRGWGMVGHREFKQSCNSKLFTLLLLREEGVCASSHMWRSEDSIWKLVLSSYCGIKDWTKVVMLTQQVCTCWATSLPWHTAPHDALRQNQKDCFSYDWRETNCLVAKLNQTRNSNSLLFFKSLLHFPQCNIHKG